jgi:hypothetical protein
MDKYYVYGHYKTGESDIPFYIGKGNGRRAYEKTRQNKHWHSIVDKYGYVVKILAEGLSQEESFWLETQLIGMFGRHDLGNGPLVNHTDGGDGGSGHKYVPSEEVKQRTSRTMKNAPHTDEHNKNVSKALMGKHLGRTPWNKGKKTGKPSWNKGIPQSVSAKEKNRAAHRKENLKETTLRKMSESHLNQIPWNKGKKKKYK